MTTTVIRSMSRVILVVLGRVGEIAAPRQRAKFRPLSPRNREKSVVVDRIVGVP